MARLETIPYNPALLRTFLDPGEELLLGIPDNGELLLTYGSEIFPIRNEYGVEGNSVFLVMHSHEGASEPVEVVAEAATFKVRPVAGRGVLLRSYPAEGSYGTVKPYYLDARRPSTVEIEWGEAYSYVNMGDEPFVVRDDAYPDFKEDYEIPATDLSLLRRLASYGIEPVLKLLPS